MRARPAPRAAAPSPAREALRDAATLLLGHFVPEARRVLEARAPEAGAAALAAIAEGRGPMEIRDVLLQEIARA